MDHITILENFNGRCPICNSENVFRCATRSSGPSGAKVVFRIYKCRICSKFFKIKA